MGSCFGGGVRGLVVLTAVALGASCQGPEEGGEALSSSRESERGGIAMQSRVDALASPSQVVDARKSLAVTDAAILANFPLPAVLNQLAAQIGNPAFTGTHLFRQLWDTQNPAPGQPDLQPG